jgi:PhzF family phenazine biosynthesis protein
MAERLNQTLETLHAHSLFTILAPFSPTLAGTIPLRVDIEGSDADIICGVRHHDVFCEVVYQHFYHYPDFTMRQVEINGVQSSIASFLVYHSDGAALPVEIFGQKTPVWEQFAARHFWVEARLLWVGNDNDRQTIRKYKRRGMKTEPAFALHFCIPGEPYSALFRLFSASDDDLLAIIQNAASHRRIVETTLVPWLHKTPNENCAPYNPQNCICFAMCHLSKLASEYPNYFTHKGAFMPTFPFYQVDAFTKERFHGNPAAVVPLDAWLPDATLQAIAEENNLAETAYFIRREDGSYDLRWFTPELEMVLCGHATLASAYVLHQYLDFTGDTVRFHTKSGELFVANHGDKLALDFPARPLHPLPVEQHRDFYATLSAILGKPPVEIFHSVNNYLAVYESETDVRSMKPNFLALNEIKDIIGVIVTAQGSANSSYDCVSRYFAPAASVPEDPVTGSAHCSIVPYWAEKLGKTSLLAYQASARGGELECELRRSPSGDRAGDRVIMAGYVTPYLRGTIEV